MDRRLGYIVLLLIAGQLTGECWHFFDSPEYTPVAWFYDPPNSLPDITWYVKDIGDSVSKLLWFYGFYLAASRLNSRLAGIVLCFIFFFFCELILFFVCYKVYGYQYVYCATGIFMFLTLYKK